MNIDLYRGINSARSYSPIFIKMVTAGTAEVIMLAPLENLEAKEEEAMNFKQTSYYFLRFAGESTLTLRLHKEGRSSYPSSSIAHLKLP
jgi:hypothetical protein